MNFIQKLLSFPRFAEKPNPINENRMSMLLQIMATRSAYSYENPFEMLPNPDEILSKNNKTIEEYSKLKYDAHVYSCIQSRKSAVLSLEWELNRGGKETQESKFIKGIFDNLDLRNIISEMLDAPLLGFKPMEIYWKEENGYIVPGDIKGKPPHWFTFDSFNLLRFRSKDAPIGTLVPQKKFLLLQSEATYDNPYGEAVLTKCFYPVIFKKGGLKLWALFTEKYGMPYMHGKLLAGSTQGDIEDFMLKLTNLRQDGVIVTEEETEIDLKESNRTSSADIYRGLLHFCNAEISKAILSQTLTTEQGDTGSYAMSQTHLQVRKDVVDNDKKLVEYAINKLIEWTIDLNFANPQDYPRFLLYEEEDVDKSLADRDAALVPVLQNSGLKYSKKYMMAAYNLQEDDLDESQQPKQAAFKEFEFEDTGLEKLSEIGNEDFRKAFDLILQPVLKMISKGRSFEDIQDKIVEIFPKLNTDQIEELIAKGILLSSVGGTIAGKP